MKVFINSNVLFSACITPHGKTADLIINPAFDFEKFSCHYLIIELFKHKNKIMDFANQSEEKVLEVIYSYLKGIELVNEGHLASEIWLKAEELTNEVDKNDIAFVALTIHMENSFLWTNDKPLIKGLKRKGFERILTTNELLVKLIKSSNED